MSDIFIKQTEMIVHIFVIELRQKHPAPLPPHDNSRTKYELDHNFT